MSKVLLVDDEQDILDMLGYNLSKEGFEVFYAKNGKIAIEKAKEIKPEIIVLDIMMPEMDGVEACKKIKEVPDLQSTMVAFLTARSEEYTEIACLEAGADDFIKKPVRPRLFLTHIKALLRRYLLVNDVEQGRTIRLGNINLNVDTFQLFISGKEVYLTKKEFDVLHLLMKKPNKVFLRNDIYSHVWGEEVMVGERTIDVHVSKLREKIGAQHILTVKKVGYRFQV